MGDEELQPAHDAEEPSQELELVEPVDSERRMARAKAAAKRRRLKKLKKAKLDDRQLEELDKILEKDEPAAPPPAEPAIPPEIAEQVAALANLSTQDLVSTFWNSINQVFLKGTEYELDGPKTKLLVDAWVPVADKYLPAVAASPEAGAVVVTAVVLGAPLLKKFLSAKKKPVAAAAVPEGAEKAAA